VHNCPGCLSDGGYAQAVSDGDQNGASRTNGGGGPEPMDVG